MMKKMLLLTIVVLLLLTACSTAPSTENTTGNAQGDWEFHGIYEMQHSLDGYYNYVETYQKQIPNTFVHLDNLPELGTFDGFVPTTDFPNRYQYSFLDSRRRELYLEITHLSSSNGGSLSTSEHSLAIVSKDMTSMNKASQAKSVIVRNGFEYYYGNDRLLSKIVWYSDGIQYKLSGQLNHNGSYNNSLYKQLLSLDETEANAAFEEIKQALNSK